MRSTPATPPGAALRPAVLVWRAAHGVIAVGFLASIAYVWWCALTGRRGPWLRRAIAALAGEAVLVATNHGDCPLGPVGDRVGDAVPLFELVLSPRAARRAIPALGLFTAAGIGLLAARRPRHG
jgi:hypothetical protein